MEIKVNFLDNLKLEAKFDDFTVIADQPIRYKGDGSAPGHLIISSPRRLCVLPILLKYIVYLEISQPRGSGCLKTTLFHLKTAINKNLKFK